MPEITAYRITRERRESMIHETVDAKDYREFRATLFDYEDGTLGWNPRFPCALPIGYEGISSEALYRSNHRTVLKMFADHGLQDFIETGLQDTFELRGESTHAVALAAQIEDDASAYPVLDEADLSELESELIDEGIIDFFAVDVADEMRKHPELSFLFDDENEREVYPEFDSIVGREIKSLAQDSVSYSGELYADDLEKMLRWNSYGATVAQYAHGLKVETADARRAEFEKYQSPITGITGITGMGTLD